MKISSIAHSSSSHHEKTTETTPKKTELPTLPSLNELFKMDGFTHGIRPHSHSRFTPSHTSSNHPPVIIPYPSPILGPLSPTASFHTSAFTNPSQGNGVDGHATTTAPQDFAFGCASLPPMVSISGNVQPQNIGRECPPWNPTVTLNPTHQSHEIKQTQHIRPIPHNAISEQGNIKRRKVEVNSAAFALSHHSGKPQVTSTTPKKVTPPPSPPVKSPSGFNFSFLENNEFLEGLKSTETPSCEKLLDAYNKFYKNEDTRLIPTRKSVS